jgi:hypothetical protein
VASQNLQSAEGNAADAHSLANHRFSADSTGLAPAGTIPCVRYHATADPDATLADNAVSGALATSAAEDRSRDQMNAMNASLLGYSSWWDATGIFKGTPLEHRRQDIIDELEHDRYFVIIMAYDFQKMWKQKQHKLLWEPRFSVRQRGVDFEKALPLMAKNAAKYFGKDSHGLLHEDLPDGHVEVGPLKILGTIAAK